MSKNDLSVMTDEQKAVMESLGFTVYSDNRELTDELSFVIALAYSKKFVSAFCDIMKAKYFTVPEYGRLADYCIRYYKKYNQNIKGDLVAYTLRHKDEFTESGFDLMIRALENGNELESDLGLAGKYDSPYLIDRALDYIKAKIIKDTIEKINTSFEQGNHERGIEYLQKMKLPEVQKQGILNYEDSAKLKDIFNKSDDYLIKLPGHLGQLTGGLARGDFFTYIAGTGIGKSWALIWTAAKCREAGLNVLFISLEMSLSSVVKRFQQVNHKRALKMDTYEKPILRKSGSKYTVDHEDYTPKTVDSTNVDKLNNLYNKKFPTGSLSICCESAISVESIKGIVANIEETKGFTPDVIVVDYADKILMGKTNNYREGLGYIWRELRDIALNKDCLMVTASQTTRQSMRSHFKMTDIAEDIRKVNEASLVVGLMATDEEVSYCVRKVSLFKIRDGVLNDRSFYTISDYRTGNIFNDSVWEYEFKVPKRIYREDTDIDSPEDKPNKIKRTFENELSDYRRIQRELRAAEPQAKRKPDKSVLVKERERVKVNKVYKAIAAFAKKYKDKETALLKAKIKSDIDFDSWDNLFSGKHTKEQTRYCLILGIEDYIREKQGVIKKRAILTEAVMRYLLKIKEGRI